MNPPKDIEKIHVVFNAMSIHPGGGLTVLLGLLKGLSLSRSPRFKLTVLCCKDLTRQAIESQGIADEVLQCCANASLFHRQLWMKRSLPRLVKQLDADVFFTINQYLTGVKVPQVVYHLNLLRFMPIERGKGLKHYVLEWLRNRASEQALKHATVNLFESKYLAECAAKIYSRNVPEDQILHIGLPDALLDMRPSESRSYEPSRLFSITSPLPHKDNPTLFRTLVALIEKRPEIDWRLEIAGGINTAWDAHQALARELGVFDRITWLGFLDQQAITERIQRALCLVSTSVIESFGMVALESMARGCPPIVADCTAMPESVGDAALLVPPGAPEQFAEAVIELHDFPERRAELVARGYQWIENFSWNTCGRQLATLLEQLVDPSSSDGLPTAARPQGFDR